MVVPLKGQCRGTDGAEMVVEIAAAEAVVIVAGAVLCHPDGAGQHIVESLGALHNALRIDLPIQIVAGTVLGHAVADTRDGGAGVIVQADEVGVLALGQLSEVAHREGKSTQRHGLRQRILKQKCRQLSAQTMPWIALVFRRKDAQMVGAAHHGVGIAHGAALFMEHFVGVDVTVGKIFHNSQRVAETLSGRGPHAEEVGVHRVDIGLVDGDVVAAQVAEALCHQGHQLQIVVQVLTLGETALVLKPHGVGEVVDGQQRTDAALAQRRQLLPIARNSGFIHLSLSGHQTGPLHAEAV